MTQTPSTSPQPIEPGPVERSGMALWSMILGLLGFVTCGVTGIIGLVLGIIAMAKIGGSQGRLGGRGLALSGILLGAITTLVMPIALMIGLLLPSLAKAREVAKSAKASISLVEVHSAMNQYVGQYDAWPAADDWVTTLTTNSSMSPVIVQPDGYRMFAMNDRLSGLNPDDLTDPAGTVLLFEIDAGGPISGGPDALAKQPMSQRGHLILTADGQTDWYDEVGLSHLYWDP